MKKIFEGILNGFLEAIGGVIFGSVGFLIKNTPIVLALVTALIILFFLYIKMREKIQKLEQMVKRLLVEKNRRKKTSPKDRKRREK